MIKSLEHNGQPCIFNPDIGYVRTENFTALPAGTTLTVCAWCDPDKRETKKLIAAGYKTSHGICEHHAAEQLKELS
jgi:hypothetical protein